MSGFLSLRATDLAFAYGDRVVFDGVNFLASAGQRVGLVGENGLGKSTLLRLLAGVATPQAGTVTRDPDSGFLVQELPFPTTATLADVLDDALAETRAMAAELDRLAEAMAADPEDGAVLDRYGAVLDWAQAHD